MSNFILGNICCKLMSKDDAKSICSSIKAYCENHNIGVHFGNDNAEKCKNITFQLSDNFCMLHCEQFMEPIIFTFDGRPLVESIIRDLDTLEGLIKDIFRYNLVNRIELRFSYVEVEECEYEEYETNICKMKSVIFSKFMENTQVPVIKVIIKK